MAWNLRVWRIAVEAGGFIMFVLDPTTLVGFHTWLSLIAIVAGFPMTAALLKGHLNPRWNGVFLSTAFAASATGYAFHFDRVLPSHIVGAVSLVLIALAGLALYAFALRHVWRRIADATERILEETTFAEMIVRERALEADQAGPPLASARA